MFLACTFHAFSSQWMWSSVTDNGSFYCSTSQNNWLICEALLSFIIDMEHWSPITNKFGSNGSYARGGVPVLNYDSVQMQKRKSHRHCNPSCYSTGDPAVCEAGKGDLIHHSVVLGLHKILTVLWLCKIQHSSKWIAFCFGLYCLTESRPHLY